jgi:hypothetical protein
MRRVIHRDEQKTRKAPAGAFFHEQSPKLKNFGSLFFSRGQTDPFQLIGKGYEGLA